jgi:hypothetical protein
VVLAAFGQSNSQNFGEAKHVAGPQVVVLDWRDGFCYPAADPLRGTSGEGGSLWSRVGDGLVARTGRPVVIVTFGAGNSKVADWTSSPLADKIDSVGATLAKANLSPTWVIWQQGETDAWTSPPTTGEDYESKLRVVATHALAKIGRRIIAAMSFCSGPGQPALRAAVERLIEEGVVERGADFDTNVSAPGDRIENCHLSAVGLDKGAALWLEVLR